MSYGEVESHFSTLKITGETRVDDKFRNLEHGDLVFVVQRGEVKKLQFPQDKDGLINRQQVAKADEMFVISPEDWDELAAKYRIEPTGPLDEELERLNNQ
jgi:hypothetical protein